MREQDWPARKVAPDTGATHLDGIEWPGGGGGGPRLRHPGSSPWVERGVGVARAISLPQNWKMMHPKGGSIQTIKMETRHWPSISCFARVQRPQLLW